ncbi:MAG: TonB-dependent receptor [candidate division Zixibacteria bacterium]|nr:TonB-dependent receptor [candidate division Zixibacteria bacterium]
MKSSSIAGLLSGLWLAFMPSPSQSASFSGTVVDPERHPLRSVTVAGNVRGRGAITDSLGHFFIVSAEAAPDSPQPGVAQLTHLTFSSVGFAPRRFAVSQLPDTIILSPIYYEGKEITVTANRAKAGVTPVAFENISRDEIMRDYTVGDLPTLLQTSPNLYSYSDAGGGLGYTYTQIRGFDDKRIATYLNGVPLNDPEDQYAYWVDLPDFTSSVSDVQIQRGVGNSLYGDASFGGSINVVSGILGKERMTSVTSGYGEFSSNSKAIGKTTKQTFDYASGLIDGQWAFGGRFSKQKSDGYREQSWVDSWAYHLSLARLDPNMTTELQLFGGPTSLHLAYYGIPRDTPNRRSNPLTYENETDNFNQPHYHLHNTYLLSQNATLYNTLYYIRGRGYFEQYIGDALYSDYNIDSTFTDSLKANGDLIRRQSVAKYQIGWNPRFDLVHSRGSHSLGGSYYFFESDHIGTVEWSENSNRLVLPGHRYYQYYGKKHVASFYAQEYFKITDRLSTQATAQLRYQTYSFNQERFGAFQGYQYDVHWLFLSPRLGFNYLLSDNEESKLNVYTNFALASRTPTDAALYDASDPYITPSFEIDDILLTASGDSAVVFGDPTARSERVYDLEIGSVYRTQKYSFGVNLFRMDFKDEIIPYGGINPSTGQAITVNADGSVRSGIELNGSINLTKPLSLSGSLAFNRYRIKDFVDTIDVYDGTGAFFGQAEVNLNNRRGLGFPDMLGSFVADLHKNSWRLTYRLQMVGKQYLELVNIESLAIEAFTVSSLSAQLTLKNALNIGNLTLSGTIDNLFDLKYERSGYGWNYGVIDPSTGGVTLAGDAEYYVAAERSFYAQLRLELF